MFNNPVSKAIVAGQLLVNLPSIFIGLTLPFAIRQLSIWINGSVSQEVIIFSLLFGIAMSWLWWSFSITHWRIWAFNSVSEAQLPLLKKRALQFLLIHHDHSIFNRTEIRNRVQKEIVWAINDQIWVEEQMLLLFQDVNAIPQTAYTINRKRLIREFSLRVFVALVGLSIIVYSPLPFIGLIIITITIFSGNKINSARYINQSEPLMNLNSRGLQFEYPQKQFFYWDEIHCIRIDKKHQQMIIQLYERKLPIQKDLSFFAIQDYTLLRKRMKFFMRRDVEKWQE